MLCVYADSVITWACLPFVPTQYQVVDGDNSARYTSHPLRFVTLKSSIHRFWYRFPRSVDTTESGADTRARWTSRNACFLRESKNAKRKDRDVATRIKTLIYYSTSGRVLGRDDINFQLIKKLIPIEAGFKDTRLPVIADRRYNRVNY